MAAAIINGSSAGRPFFLGAKKLSVEIRDRNEASPGEIEY